MPGGDAMDAAVGARHDPALAIPLDEQHNLPAHTSAVEPVVAGRPVVVSKEEVARRGGGGVRLKGNYLPPDEDGHVGMEGDEWPTEEDLHTLRKVPDKISWTAYTVAFVELCERFSYYGTAVVFQNYIQRPLPVGSTTGAVVNGGNQAGALGRGQQTATGISTFLQFWIYTTPLFGAYIADAHWGRYKTICVALVMAITSHVLLIIAAVPGVINQSQASLGIFMLGIVILGLGTGGFKPNVSPLVVEQLPLTKTVVRTLPSGERIVHDPSLTANRVYMYFYLFINVGALIGQVCMTFAEKYVGFWLAWLLPTLVFCCCPAVMLWGRKRYRRTPPQGSVLYKAMRLWIRAQRGRWSLNPLKTWRQLHDGTMWESVKPSNTDPALRPKWMTYDDAWVDEVRRGFAACAVFVWYPLFWICYNQINNNLTSQASLMELNGLPNDVISNIDPLALVVLIPVFDQIVYPLLRRFKINFTPIKRIVAGFACGFAAMIWAGVLQLYIYKMSPCGYDASTCSDENDNVIPAPINIGAQTGAFILIAISEIFGSVTSLEYAFSKAPKNMRSLVQAVALFTNAIAAAIGEALVPLANDPLLIWNYMVPAILAAFGGIVFWIQFRELDAQEDILNILPAGHTDAPEKAIVQSPADERPVAQTIDIDEEKHVR